jgi:hypothetical protein
VTSLLAGMLGGSMSVVLGVVAWRIYDGATRTRREPKSDYDLVWEAWHALEAVAQRPYADPEFRTELRLMGMRLFEWYESRHKPSDRSVG